MKKILPSFVLLFLFSCSNDSSSESAENLSDKIIGRWNLTNILENGNPVSGYSCNKNFDINEYFSDGSATIKYSDKDSKNICKQYSEDEKYTIKDGILTETQKKGSIVVFESKYRIKEINDNSLKLEAISIFEANDDGSDPIKEDYVEGEEVKTYIRVE